MTMQAVIPFSGFYESVHSYELDHAAEQMISDDSGNPIAELADRFSREFSYSNAMLHAYGKLYAEEFSRVFGVACTVGAIDSPKYYNFETDRIFVDIDETEVRRIHALVNVPTLAGIARQRHTSRDGFISYYSPHIDTWGDVAEWEPEQLHTLLLAYVQEHDAWEEHDCEERGLDWVLVEDIDCNGDVSNLVYDNLSDKAKRIVKVADYLRERANRKYRKYRTTA
jgi:hypothetical protein